MKPNLPPPAQPTGSAATAFPSGQEATQFRSFLRRMMDTPGAARAFLLQSGFYDRKGRLKPRFR